MSFPLEHYVGFWLAGARPHVNADDVLARIFGAFEAFIAQLHAGLVLAVRPIGTLTFDASSVLRQFSFQFDMAMDRRHTKLPSREGQVKFQRARRLLRGK